MSSVHGWMAIIGVVVLLGAIGCAAEKEETAGANKMHGSDIHEDPESEAAAAAVPETIDPVSGNPVAADDAPSAIFLDATYRFESNANLQEFRSNPNEYATTIDPVSGESICTSDAAFKTTYAGRSWYFSSKENLEAFESEQERYATYKCHGCGMTGLLAKPTVLSESISGNDFHFCCSHCQEAFMEEADTWTALIVPEDGIAK